MPKRSNHTSPRKLNWRWPAVYAVAAMMPCLCIMSLAYLHLHTSLADWQTTQTMQANGQLMIEVSHLTRELQLERGLAANLQFATSVTDGRVFL